MASGGSGHVTMGIVVVLCSQARRCRAGTGGVISMEGQIINYSIGIVVAIGGCGRRGVGGLFGWRGLLLVGVCCLRR